MSVRLLAESPVSIDLSNSHEFAVNFIIGQAGGFIICRALLVKDFKQIKRRLDIFKACRVIHISNIQFVKKLVRRNRMIAAGLKLVRVNDLCREQL